MDKQKKERKTDGQTKERKKDRWTNKRKKTDGWMDRRKDKQKKEKRQREKDRETDRQPIYRKRDLISQFFPESENAFLGINFPSQFLEIKN